MPAVFSGGDEPGDGETTMRRTCTACQRRCAATRFRQCLPCRKEGRRYAQSWRQRQGMRGWAQYLAAKKAPIEELLADLRQVAGGRYLTTRRYRDMGRYHPETLRKRCGSWPLALQAAGVPCELWTVYGCLRCARRFPSPVNRLCLVCRRFRARQMTGGMVVNA